jgi:hypothetical protein
MKPRKGVVVVLIAAAALVLVWNAPVGAGCSVNPQTGETGEPPVPGSLQIDLSAMRGRNGRIEVTRVAQSEEPPVTASIRGSFASRAECSVQIAAAEAVALVPRGTSASVAVRGIAIPVEVTKEGRVVGRLGADASPGTTLTLRW